LTKITGNCENQPEAKNEHKKITLAGLTYKNYPDSVNYLLRS